MNFITTRFAALRRDTKGQDLLEYALLVALIAVVCVGVVRFAGLEVQEAFQAIVDAMNA